MTKQEHERDLHTATLFVSEDCNVYEAFVRGMNHQRQGETKRFNELLKGLKEYMGEEAFNKIFKYSLNWVKL